MANLPTLTQTLLPIVSKSITNNPFVSQNPIATVGGLVNLYKMLKTNAPNLTSAISQHKGLLPGIAENINNGYDLRLLEEDFNNFNKYFDIDDPWSFYDLTDAIGNFDNNLNRQEFLKYEPNLKPFPSDNKPILPYESDVLNPSKLRNQIIKQPNVVDWYREIMSETRNQPAMQSAISMLIDNPDIGLKRR